jgi:hypothetical protein
MPKKYITVLSKTNIRKRPIELPQKKNFNPKENDGDPKKNEKSL